MGGRWWERRSVQVVAVIAASVVSIGSALLVASSAIRWLEAGSVPIDELASAVPFVVMAIVFPILATRWAKGLPPRRVRAGQQPSDQT